MSNKVYDWLCIVAIGIGGTMLFKYGLIKLIVES